MADLRPAPVEARDVTRDLLALAEDVADSWFPDDSQPIDWDVFIDRLSESMRYAGWDEFDTYWSPAVGKVQRHVRAYRRS